MSQSTLDNDCPLPDCTKIKLADMDLVRRTVKCPFSARHDTSSNEDVSSGSPGEGNMEEEEMTEELSFATEDRTSEETRLRTLIGNLDCMLRRTQAMQLAIKARKEKRLIEAKLSSLVESQSEEQQTESSQHDERTPATTPPVGITPLYPFPAPLSFENRVAVRDAKHRQERMQCQIDEMICRYNTLRCLIRKMRTMLSSLRKELRHLFCQTNGYAEWSREILKGRYQCLERFRIMLKTKIPKVEAHRLNKQHIAKAFKLTKANLQDNQFKMQMNEFRCEINDVMQHVHDLRIEMQRQFEIMEHETLLRSQRPTLQKANKSSSQDGDSDKPMTELFNKDLTSVKSANNGNSIDDDSSHK